MMPPPPKNLKNMPPLPPRPNMPQRPPVQAQQQKTTADVKPTKTASVNVEVKKVEKPAVVEKVDQQQEELKQVSKKEEKSVSKSSGGSKFLYWLGFFLCLIGMGVAVYFLLF